MKYFFLLAIILFIVLPCVFSEIIKIPPNEISECNQALKLTVSCNVYDAMYYDGDEPVYSPWCMTRIAPHPRYETITVNLNKISSTLFRSDIVRTYQLQYPYSDGIYIEHDSYFEIMREDISINYYLNDQQQYVPCGEFAGWKIRHVYTRLSDGYTSSYFFDGTATNTIYSGSCPISRFDFTPTVNFYIKDLEFNSIYEFVGTAYLDISYANTGEINESNIITRSYGFPNNGYSKKHVCLPNVVPGTETQAYKIKYTNDESYIRKSWLFDWNFSSCKEFEFDCSLSNICGDGICEGDEVYYCPEDCNGYFPDPFCGDGSCDDGETPENCPEDCEPIELVNGVCGNRVGNYSVVQYMWPVGSVYCESGLPSQEPNFPNLGESVDWVCLGGGGGENSNVCIATRDSGDDPPIDECDNDVPCDDGFYCDGGVCKPIVGFANSIVDFTGVYSNGVLNLNTLCIFDNIGSLKIFEIDGLETIHEDIFLDCNSSKTNNFVEGDFSVSTIGLNFKINEPCYVCEKTIYVNINERKRNVAIPDINSLLVLAIFSMTLFILKKRNSN